MIFAKLRNCVSSVLVIGTVLTTLQTHASHFLKNFVTRFILKKNFSTSRFRPSLGLVTPVNTCVVCKAVLEKIFLGKCCSMSQTSWSNFRPCLKQFSFPPKLFPIEKKCQSGLNKTQTNYHQTSKIFVERRKENNGKEKCLLFHYWTSWRSSTHHASFFSFSLLSLALLSLLFLLSLLLLSLLSWGRMQRFIIRAMIVNPSWCYCSPPPR